MRVTYLQTIGRTMKHPAIKPNLVFITISSLMLSSQAYSIETPIYKWQDNRGITQYSDRAPNVAYKKATRFEMINSLQAIDLCTAPSTSSSVYLPKSNLAASKTPEYSANFFGGSNNPRTIASGATGGTGAIRSIGATKVAATSPAKPAATVAKPAATVANSAAKAPANSIGASAFKPRTGASSNSFGGSLFGNIAGAPTNSIGASAFGPRAGASTNSLASKATATQTAAAQAAADQAAESSYLIQRGLMPAVDIRKNIIPEIGYSTLRIQDTTELPTINPNPFGGEFRVVCKVSHMSNDDPLVYPNQPGAAHHHMFFGNTTINSKSDLNNLSNVGNSTCNGGIMNRSGYWAPSMIDTVTNAPIVPDFSIFYYKAAGAPGAQIKAPPKGLKMIGGNPKGNSVDSAKAAFTCIPPNDGVVRPFWGWHKSIQACNVGWEMDMTVFFNQCWDGINLDSPDHQSHMAGSSDSNNTPARIAAGTANRCPDTHPIAIPQIALNMRYKVKTGMDLSKWRLASDNYDKSLPGGYSSHADWINGWDEKIMEGIIKNCINIKGDCHAHLLGAGKAFY